MIFRIIRSQLSHKPLPVLLSTSLLMLGTAIISLLIILQDAFSQKMDKDLKDIDIVLGAKGSPLQLVLSAVYHMDAPTGNIPMEEVKKLQKGKMIASTTPLAYGDTYKGYRILGTDASYIERYGGEFKDGNIFQKDFDAVLGARIAALSGLKVGDTFVGTHGNDANAHTHDEAPYQVTGILHSTGTVLDFLIITNLHTVWAVHHSSGHQHDEGEDGHHDEEPEEITALLIQLKSPMALMTLPRTINETSSLQAAVPSLEINRLFGLLGIGTATLQAIAWAIIIISAFSIFIAMYNRMQERLFEMALIRLMGGNRVQLAQIILLEAWTITLMGYILGWLLSRLGIWMISQWVEESRTWPIRYSFSESELFLPPLIFFIGTLSAIIPVIQALKLNISKTLAND
jgi:putative ABC transport system permease protein